MSNSENLNSQVETKKKRTITKAVIAAAGTGTRFLPATKNQPKEMLPIIDKPIIHYLVEEAVASGIKDIILVTRAGNHIMEDYFDNKSDLENYLLNNGKLERLEIVKEIPKMANFIYVRQKSHLPYGNGTPLLSVQNLIDDDEAFVFMWGDDMTLSDGVPVTKQVMDVYEKTGANVVMGVQEVPDSEVDRYGTIRYRENPKFEYEVEEACEKFPIGQQPSNMAQFGRFVMDYSVIEAAQSTATGKGNELWVTDILNTIISEGALVIAPPIEGEWLTTGDPLRYMQTMLKFAMKRQDLRDDLLEFIKSELI